MIKRKTKSILLSVATSLCVALSAFSMFLTKGTGRAFADAVGTNNTLFTQNVTADYNVTPSNYLGIEKSVGTKVTFSAGETVTFAQEIIVGEGMTDLVDFAPHPKSVYVNGDKLYKYDLEQLKIRVDKLDENGQPVADAYIETLVFTNTEDRAGIGSGGNGSTDDWTGNGLGAIYAYGPNQQVGGYRERENADNVKVGRLNTLGTGIYFSFYKGAVNGRERNDRLLLQYNAQTNSLHFANAVTYGTNDTKVIREFGKQYDKLNIHPEKDKNTSIADEVTFKGFSAGDKLRISVTTVGNTEAQDIFFYQTGGTPAIIPVHVPVDKALMLDSENKLTAPVAGWYSADGLTVKRVDLASKTGAEWKVEAIGQGADGADLLVQDFTAYNSTDAKVTLQNADTTPITGECRFTYRIPKGTGYDQYSAIFEVMTEETANTQYPLTITQFKADWTADNRYPDNISEFAIPVSAVMTSEMDRNGFDSIQRTFSVYKDADANGVYNAGTDGIAEGYYNGATEKTALQGCDLSAGASTFNVDQEGTYFVVYKAVDGLGRTLTSQDIDAQARPKPIIVSFSGHSFVEGITVDEIKDGAVRTVSRQMLSAEKVKTLTFSKADVDFYDYRVNSVNPAFTLDLKITNPNGVKQTYYTDYKFDFVGEYALDYTLYYKTDSGENVIKTITKLLDVYDDVAPTLTMDDDVRLDGDKPSTDNVKYGRATVGSKIFVNNVTARDSFGRVTDLRSAITCSLVLPNGTTQDLTQTMREKNYFLSVTFDTAGVYTLLFAVTDDAENNTMVRYEIDVRPEWLNVSVLAGMPEQVNSASNLYIPDFKICGVAGNELPDKSGTSGLYAYVDEQTVNLVKDNVAATTVKDLAPGTYFVKYAVAEGDLSHEKRIYFTVIDTTNPTIQVSGGTATGKAGERLPLATFSATDNGTIRETKLVVTKDGVEVNVYDNHFVPATEGTYTVAFTAIDIAGNKTTSSYQVTVVGTAVSSDSVVENTGCACASSVMSVGAVLALAGVLLSVLIVRKYKQQDENNM